MRRLALLAALAACVDQPFGPVSQAPATIHLALTLPPATPAVWTPIGETLHVAVRRAGQTAPMLDTAFVITDTVGVALPVPLNYSTEQFVATAEVRYGSMTLFLGFDAIRLRAGTDTAITLTAEYVGPGARAASYALGARDSSLGAGDTASLAPVVLDSSGQTIPNVPVRYRIAGPAQVTVDSSGVLAAAPASPADTARVTGYLPMGLVSGLVVRVVPNIVPPPVGLKLWIGGAGTTAQDSTDWFNAANWDPAGVPGAGDTVLIDHTLTDPVLTGRDTVAAMRIVGGSLFMGRGTLVVLGDFSTEGTAGALEMNQPEDTVRVLGNALFAGSLGEGSSDGVLLVAGDLDIPNVGVVNFRASGNHKTVLNGTQPQRLSFAGGNWGAEFRHLEIANTARIIIGDEDQIHVTGKMRVTTPVTIDNGSGGNGDVQLEVEDSLIMAAGSQLTVVELTLGGGMAVAGAFVPQPGGSFSVRFQGSGQRIQAGLDYRMVEVNSDALLTGPTTFENLEITGSLHLAGQSLTVTGRLHTDNGEGRLIMHDPADQLDVLGDAVFEGDSVRGLLTDGVLRVAGAFTQLRYSNKPATFRASGNHRTVLNGTGPQNLLAQHVVSFGHLEIATTAGPVGVDAQTLVVERTFRLAAPVTVFENGAEPSLHLQVDDSLITVPGSRLEAATIELRGVLAAAGELETGGLEFAGTNQDIPPGPAYHGIIVSGTARLAGRIVAGGMTIYGPQASLTLGGRTLHVATLGVGLGSGTQGTLVMENPSDSVIVTGTTAFQGAQQPGSMTAGVLVVGGGFFQVGEPTAFQPSGTHRTVLNSTPADAIEFAHPGPGGSAFRHLDIGGTGLFLRTNVPVTGTLGGGRPVAPVISGLPGTGIIAAGADLAGLTLQGVTLAVGNGLVRLDSVAFEQQSPSAVQLTVTHPGGAAPITLNGLRFATTPTTGAYISATDSAPADGQVLTLTLDGSFPADGSGHTSTSGGAVVNWAGGTPPFSLTQVSAGVSYSCGLTTTGQAFCWGRNDAGRLGTGTLDDWHAPQPVAGGLTFISIGTGDAHTCALTAAGAAWCWGSGEYGQLGIGGGPDSSLVPVQVSGGHVFTQLAVGEQHNCGLTAAGQVFCWGRNDTGEIGDNTNTNRFAPVPVSFGLPFASISAGGGTCGLGTNGLAYCWGRNINGQLGDGTRSDRYTPTPVDGAITFASISANAGEHTCAVTPGGQGYCWGWNNFGELGDGTATRRLTPVPVGGSHTWAAIHTGGSGFTCGLTTAGAAFCWGVNTSGQLGDSTTTFSRPDPTAVSGGFSFSALESGFAHVLAITGSGVVYAWGANNAGQLGIGTTTPPVRTPVIVGVPIP